VRFPISGPLRYTMTATDAAELCGLIDPRTVVPIHYEGWKHFREGRAAAERAFAGAPKELAARVQWLELGAPATIEV
jgi:L-ascorbate metabolism protein UlaG (beta-lactamase superfamily)